MKQLLKNKKGFGEGLLWVARLLFLAAVLAGLTAFYAFSNTAGLNAEDVRAQALVLRLTHAPNGISFVDGAGRLHIEIIDYNKLSDNITLATLYNSTSITVNVSIDGEDFFTNKRFYTLAKPLASFGKYETVKRERHTQLLKNNQLTSTKMVIEIVYQ
ncbi:hypothetical protein GOV04_02385 [Candidatus Woesearchaeota archaeon]|nr:hypothetical protein [Candidatus Woesearchaeota archaeon]